MKNSVFKDHIHNVTLISAERLLSVDSDTCWILHHSSTFNIQLLTFNFQTKNFLCIVDDKTSLKLRAVCKSTEKTMKRQDKRWSRSWQLGFNHREYGEQEDVFQKRIFIMIEQNAILWHQNFINGILFNQKKYSENRTQNTLMLQSCTVLVYIWFAWQKARWRGAVPAFTFLGFEESLTGTKCT